MSDAAIGYGTLFYMGATPSTADASLTKLAEVTSVSLPNEQVADVEVTHYESPNRTREFISGLIDPGEITIELNYIGGSATDDLIVAAKSSGEVRPAKIIVPVGGAGADQKFTFPIIVRGYERSAPIDGRQTATVTMRIAGAVTQADVA